MAIATTPRLFAFVASTLLFAGCQSSYPQYGYQAPLNVDMSHLAAQQQTFNQGQMQPPSMGSQSMPVAQPNAQQVIVTTEAEQRLSAVTAQLTELQDRLSRTERAMLRLDRRMQLVEANELSRMDGAQMSSLESSVQPVSMVGQSIAPNAAPESAGSLMPVSMTNFMHNQNALAQRQMGSLQQANSMSGGSALLGLPSLADTSKASAEGAAAELAVWTISYQSKKIWPERAQLKSSRDVVTALRDADRPVAVYARGKHTNSKEFRERVRAVSRYLSKVTEREQVPIAALPAEHLDGDTIEIFTAN